MDKEIEKIDSEKEILSTLPKNNKKNLLKYKEQLTILESEYNNYKNEIYNEMNKRYEKILSIKESTEIIKIKEQIRDIERILEILNNTKSSYEKMGIDKIIYKLGKFYKENLENINDEILKCINKFKEVGISISPESFNYSIYVKEYMITFLNEIKDNNISYSDVIKDKFEEIYWKCPDIIIHIELNFRYLYLKNQNLIDKYYEKTKNELLDTLNTTPKLIMEKYDELNKNLIEKEENDKAIIINDFYTEKLNIKDYEDEKIKIDYQKMLSEDMLKNNSPSEVQEYILKFINNLYEYKNFEKFKFIYLDIKNKFLEKEQHKGDYISVKKEILNKEKKLKSLNKKINGKSLFAKKEEKRDKQKAEYNKLILDIKKDYKKLDEAEIYKKINECISEDSTIYDVLNFANSFNNYLVECIIKNDKNIVNSEIEIFINDLNDFLKNPYNTIIKNITIMEERDISIMISDRYKLLNFNIEKEDISISNIDNLITILNHIAVKYNMEQEKIKIEDIKFICEFKKILEKEKSK